MTPSIMSEFYNGEFYELRKHIFFILAYLMQQSLLHKTSSVRDRFMSFSSVLTMFLLFFSSNMKLVGFQLTREWAILFQSYRHPGTMKYHHIWCHGIKYPYPTDAREFLSKMNRVQLEYVLKSACLMRNSRRHVQPRPYKLKI